MVCHVSSQEKTPYFSCFSLPPPTVSLRVMPTVALIDDHKIFCDSLQSLLSDIEGWQVLWTAQKSNAYLAIAPIGCWSEN